MLTSVCIPSYNSAERIGGALNSLLNQTVSPMEVIVCDDCSTDTTLEVVRSFQHKLPLQIYRNETNHGMVSNWNKCLSYVRGDLVTFLHDDDAYYPDFIATMARAFESDERIGLWACSMAIGDTTASSKSAYKIDGLISPTDYARLVLSMELIPPPTVTAFRRQALELTGWYSEEYKYMAEPDLYLRLFAAGFYGYNTNQVLVLRGAPETRFTNRIWYTPLLTNEIAKFIEHWAQRLLPCKAQEPVSTALAKMQNIAARAVANNLLRFRFEFIHNIITTLKTLQHNLNQHDFLSTSFEVRPFAQRVLRAVPNEIKAALRQSHLWKILRPLKNPITNLARFMRSPRTFLNNQQAHIAGNAFANELETAWKKTGVERQTHITKLFQNTSLSDFYAYYVSSRHGPHYHMPWRNGELTKLPFDFLLYKTIFESVRPAFLVEIGTQRGWSAIFFSELLQPWGGQVITIDIIAPPNLSELSKSNIIFIEGDATTPAIAEQVKQLVTNKGCLVIDDGSHAHQDVLAATRLYASLIPVNGYYIIEDGFVNRLLINTKSDALSGVDQFLDENPKFRRDDSFDRFIFFSAFQAVLRRHE